MSDERFDIIDGSWQGECSGYFSIADSRLGCGRGTANPSGKLIILPYYDTMPIPIGNGMFTTLLNNEPVMIDCFGKVLTTPKS